MDFSMSILYSFTLALHSLLRWLVLIFAVLAVVRAFAGWSGGRPWTRSDDRAGLWFTISLDIQILLGLPLYFILSPFTRVALDNFGAAMRDPNLRFWAVEHVTMMLLAAVIAHVARVRIRRAPGDAARHRRAAIGFLIALLLVLAAIPWPGMMNGRPLIRLGV
jgi:hypothetical protein